MAEGTLDKGKRRFVIGATSVVGGVGGVAAATPFVLSLFPSERAKAAGAPVEVDISKLEPGQKIDVEWRGKVVWLISRTKEMLAGLPKLDAKLADPNSEAPQQPDDCRNPVRSIKPEVFVAVGICTHLGCSPVGPFAAGSHPTLGDNMGFLCPCHGSTFDLAGRVFKDKPAPDNLEVPPHKYLSEALVLVGDDGKA